MSDAVEILIVDDEPRNLDALETILDDPGYRLIRAGDADTALKQLLQHDVAAIVLDIKMPGVSGFELAQLIKGTKKFRQIPIVFLTAYHVDESDVVMGYGAGAVDYLMKPVNPQILRHKVAVFAELFRKTRALAQLNEQLESRVLERTAALEHASRMKDEFVATISHELRTPLNAMLGWAVILQKTARDPQVKAGLDTIARNARVQERIISDLLDVSSIITGKLRLNMSRFPLASVVRAAADVVRPAATAKGLEVVMRIADDSGDTVGDADRIQQVLWNLLINAVRHTPQNGRIEVSLEREASAHVLRVVDNGSGIPPEHLPHIFERFRQVDGSLARPHGGLGLGLSIVRHLVEAHGGTVEARSDGAGKGSAFQVWLPIRAVSAGERDGSSHASSPPPPPVHATALDGVRVLVVEDVADSRELLQVILESAGAVVTGVASAEEALATLARTQSFDVIVSDIGMAVTDGYEFMKRVRSGEHGQLIPAVALTAYARPEDVHKAMRAGYQFHLAKPVEGDQLVGIVRELVPRASRKGLQARAG